MFGEYLPILMMMAIAAVVCSVMVVGSYILGPKRVTKYKQSPYECGVAPLGDANERFPIKFYLIAILFVLFDIEVVFLWPWLSVFKNASLEYKIFTGVDILIYMGIWIVGMAYVIKVGAIDWDESSSLAPEKLVGSESAAPLATSPAEARNPI
ncbi:MAG: NADH-quinone oxidoreductase subunit A [Armatimonadetes bacterium]|nr:NADH-quinone oxidoreductase subunit A [Armatimonadota bacterium]MBS1712549.1 NADH-quinone oxidoreductase subunit A [Armatimonadota bacterium]MBX3109142.1 NADH-quinone oxidoreductase subunit A [Fimbriimonadaceae bacterium]